MAVNTELARAAAALILINNPTQDQVARAISGIRTADAIDARDAREKLRTENEKLRAEVSMLRRVLSIAAGPDAVLRALDVIEYSDILDNGEDEQ